MMLIFCMLLPHVPHWTFLYGWTKTASSLETTPFAHLRGRVFGEAVLTALGLYWNAGRANRITAAIISRLYQV